MNILLFMKFRSGSQEIGPIIRPKMRLAAQYEGAYRGKQVPAGPSGSRPRDRIGKPGSSDRCVKKPVAVGTAVTRRPPHRSVQAELPHHMLSTTYDALCGEVKNVAMPR